MPKPAVDIAVISIGTPLLIGVYRDNHLTQSLRSEEKTSDALPRLFHDLLTRYELRTVYFARGPGSFMAIKLTFIFLKTLEIAHGVRLKATEGFAFNGARPIKAVGKRYFVRENDEITVKTLEEYVPDPDPFALPEHLEPEAFHDQTQPLYILPAV